MVFQPVNLPQPMKRFDIEKAFAAIFYIANAVTNIDVHKLLKIIYFADKEHIAKYGRFMFEETYSALPYGSVPSNCYDIIKTAQGINYCFMDYYDSIKRINVNNDIVTCPEPDIDYLSESEIECINNSIKIHKAMNFKQLHDKSVGYAYKRVAKNTRMNDLDIASEAGANAEMMNYIKTNIENSQLFA